MTATTKTTSNLVAKLKVWLRRYLKGALRSFNFDLTPTPASRPRVSRWGTYYAKPYTKFLKEATELTKGYDGAPTNNPIVMLIEAVCPPFKTVKREYPRGDVDNYSKGVMDVMQKVKKFFKDDNQIVGLMAFKRFADDNEEPSINVDWFELEATA